MTTAQIASAARVLIIFFGGMAVSKGWLTQDQLDLASDTAMLTAAVGGVVALGTMAYAVWLRRPAGNVAAAASEPGVQKIVTTTTKLANAVPSDKVQVGGR